MKYAGIASGAELARRVSDIADKEIPPQSVSVLLTGAVRHSRHTPSIATACGVNTHWLETGEGTMLGGVGVAEKQGQYRAYGKELMEIKELLGRLDSLFNGLSLTPESRAELSGELDKMLSRRRAAKKGSKSRGKSAASRRPSKKD